VAYKLLDDLSFDADAWEIVFDWVVDNVRIGESYLSVLRKAKRWQRSMAHRVAMRFAKTKIDVPPDFQGNPETHGIDEPRGGGFSIMQDLQKKLHRESVGKRAFMAAIRKAMVTEKTIWNTDGSIVQERTWDEGERPFTASVRQAMYWCSPERTYRMTKQEQGEGPILCPKCKSKMEQEKFTRSEKMFRCSDCGFKISTGKVVKQRIEIEIEPDGNVEVEVTKAAEGRN